MVDQEKPKEGLCYDEIKNAMYKYELAIREAVSVFEIRNNDDMLEYLMDKDMTSFWKILVFLNKG